MSKRLKNILIILLAVTILIYFGYKIYQSAFPSYTFETAIKYDFRDKFYKECYIIRDEQLLIESEDGVRSYTVQNGTRVSQGSPIMKLYPDETYASYASQLEELDKEIELLEGIKVSLSSVGELENVQASIREELKELYNNLEKGKISSLGNQKNQMLYLFSKKQLIVGDTNDFDEQIQSLKAKRDHIFAQMTVEPKTVLSPGTGYFIANIDGYEGLASTDDVSSITPDRLAELLKAKPSEIDSSVIGKLVENYHWYICVNVTADEVQKIKNRSSFLINIPSLSLSGVDVSIESINYDSTRQDAVLVLRCGYMSTELSTLRTAKIEINLASYSGIKINSEAIHFENNEEGVYVLVGSQIKFRKVDIIYTASGYVISKIDTADTTLVQPYDQIVTSGRELYSGKFVK